MLAYPRLRTRSYDVAVLNTLALTGYWTLGEPSGTVANDRTVRLTGTYVNTPTLGVAGLLSGNPNTAVTFTAASSQRITLGAPIMTDTNNWTLCAWIRPAAASALQGIVYNGADPTNGYGIYLSASNRLLGYSNGAGGGVLCGAITGGTAIVMTAGQNYFLVLVRRAGLGYGYLNGALDTGVQGGSVIGPAPATAAFIGSTTATTNFSNATIGQVASFNRALMPDEIADLYRIGRGF